MFGKPMPWDISHDMWLVDAMHYEVQVIEHADWSTTAQPGVWVRQGCSVAPIIFVGF